MQPEILEICLIIWRLPPTAAWVRSRFFPAFTGHTGGWGSGAEVYHQIHIYDDVIKHIPDWRW